MGRGTPDTDDARRRRAMVLAEATLGCYGLQDARLHLLRHGFMQVFRVKSPTGEEFALRMYSTPRAAGDEPRPDDPRLRTTVKLRSLETLREQLTWLSALARETDLLVPEPVPALDSSLVGHVSVEGVPERRHCVLLRWVPGRHKREDLTPIDFFLVGSFIARLHTNAERYHVPDPSALPRWDWQWPFGESAPLWSKGVAFYSAAQIAVFKEAAQRTRRNLEELGYGNDAFGFVHCDLNLNNLVFGDGVVGAIDFDLCGLGHYLLDVATVRATLRPLHADRAERLQQALLEGYEREHRLPLGYREYLETFAVMRRVAAVNRNLELLSSEATRHPARGYRFLRNTVTWLHRNYL